MPGLGLYLFELFFDRYHTKLDCEDERLDLSKKRKADKIDNEEEKIGKVDTETAAEKASTSTQDVDKNSASSTSGSGVRT